MIEINCPGCGKLLRVPDQARGTSGKCNGCGGIVLVSEYAPSVSQSHLDSAVPEVVETSSDWRDEPASARQLSYLADLGATPTRIQGLTKGEASELIEELERLRYQSRAENIAADMAASQREMVKAQNAAAKAIRAHTNWQKNCCGCIIILILLWVFGPMKLPPFFGQVLSKDLSA